jgi:hypothetical protein
MALALSVIVITYGAKINLTQTADNLRNTNHTGK